MLEQSKLPDINVILPPQPVQSWQDYVLWAVVPVLVGIIVPIFIAKKRKKTKK